MDVWKIATWVIEFTVGYIGIAATIYGLELVLATIGSEGLVKQYLGPLYTVLEPGKAAAKTLVDLIVTNIGTPKA